MKIVIPSPVLPLFLTCWVLTKFRSWYSLLVSRLSKHQDSVVQIILKQKTSPTNSFLSFSKFLFKLSILRWRTENEISLFSFIIDFKFSSVKYVVLLKPCILKKLPSGSNKSIKRIFSFSNILKGRFSKSSVLIFFNSYSYEKNQ